MRQASAAPEPRGIEETEARAIIDASRSETGLPLHLAADFVDLPPDGSLAIVRAHVDVSALAAGADAGLAVDFLGGVYDAYGKTVGPAFGRHTPVRRRGAGAGAPRGSLLPAAARAAAGPLRDPPGGARHGRAPSSAARASGSRSPT